MECHEDRAAGRILTMKSFLSCDWGTSSFRLRRVELRDRNVLEEVTSDQGTAVTFQNWLASGQPEEQRESFYKNALWQAIQNLNELPSSGTPLIVSGMASSTVGIISLPYQHFPFAWDPAQLIVRKIDADKEFGFPIHLVSGLRTKTDIMRGEETILLGCDLPKVGQSILIFPGTHSKHVRVENGIAVDFKTYTTGEVFNLLVERSLLSNSVKIGEDIESFNRGIIAAKTENLLHSIFMVRTRHLLEGTSPISNYQYLSGLLIGSELIELVKTSCSIIVVSEEPLLKLYLHALEVLDMKQRVNSLSARQAFINGQCELAAMLATSIQ